MSIPTAPLLDGSVWSTVKPKLQQAAAFADSSLKLWVEVAVEVVGPHPEQDWRSELRGLLERCRLEDVPAPYNATALLQMVQAHRQSPDDMDQCLSLWREMRRPKPPDEPKDPTGTALDEGGETWDSIHWTIPAIRIAVITRRKTLPPRGPFPKVAEEAKMLLGRIEEVAQEIRDLIDACA